MISSMRQRIRICQCSRNKGHFIDVAEKNSGGSLHTTCSGECHVCLGLSAPRETYSGHHRCECSGQEHLANRVCVTIIKPQRRQVGGENGCKWVQAYREPTEY